MRFDFFKRQGSAGGSAVAERGGRVGLQDDMREPAEELLEPPGANGYVSKGLGPSEIYSALMRVLAQQQQTVKA